MMVTAPSESQSCWTAAVPDWLEEENVYMIDNQDT